MARKSTTPDPESILPDICPFDELPRSALGVFEALESMRSPHRRETGAFLFYVRCPICSAKEQKEIFHWAVYSTHQIRWARAFDPFFPWTQENVQAGIYALDFNDFVRVYRRRQWFEALSDYIANHPLPEWANEWQKSAEESR